MFTPTLRKSEFIDYTNVSALESQKLISLSLSSSSCHSNFLLPISWFFSLCSLSFSLAICQSIAKSTALTKSVQITQTNYWHTTDGHLCMVLHQGQNAYLLKKVWLYFCVDRKWEIKLTAEIWETFSFCLFVCFFLTHINTYHKMAKY